MPSTKSAIYAAQRVWALSRTPSVDAKGYFRTLDENLFLALSPAALAAFSGADGGELRPQKNAPPKMHACHSSAALAANVFDYWTSRDAQPLVVALGLSGPQARMHFEKKFATGLDGNSPNLDLAFEGAEGFVVGVESKFTEWLSFKPSKEPFRPAYFVNDALLWAQQGMPECQTLVQAIRDGDVSFAYLNAPQLLKHALGLATQHGRDFEVVYLFYDGPGRESALHFQELERFGEAIGHSFRFRWLTYQALFARLETAAHPDDAPYLKYLRCRYFAKPGGAGRAGPISAH